MRDRILIICPSAKAPFVKVDQQILETRYTVDVLGIDQLRRPKMFHLPFTLTRILRTREISALIMWFSIPHLAPWVVIIGRFFKKKVLAITGGYDVAYVSSINWGEMRSSFKRRLQRFTLSRTDRVLAFSEFSRSDALAYAKPNNVEVLFQGVETGHFRPRGAKENLVITTCMEISSSTIIQKGLQAILACARALPKVRFIIIGQLAPNDEVAKAFVRSFPRNLEFTGRFVSDEELLSFCRRARVYVQASAHEGFGIACAEAMACECVPVGTLGTSLPEVIGETGFLVNYGDVQATILSIQRALKKTGLGKKARQRVVRLFDMKLRKQRLLNYMEELLS